MTNLYFEDLQVGLRAESEEIEMRLADIKAFAAQFDPQPFHLDEEAGRASFFGGLVASGWHTAATTMRLIVSGGIRAAEGTVGAGIQELRWPQPVRPGDRLHIVSEIVEIIPSRSKPDRGLARVRVTTLNQNGETVQSMVSTIVVPRRPAKDI